MTRFQISSAACIPFHMTAHFWFVLFIYFKFIDIYLKNVIQVNLGWYGIYLHFLKLQTNVVLQ